MSVYDEVEIEDMVYDEILTIFHYPCPCGDRFEIALGDLQDGEDIAVCPSCSLMIKVIFDPVSYDSCAQQASLADLHLKADLPGDPDDAAPTAPMAVTA